MAIRLQCFGKPQAAVGVRFIVPAYMYSPRIRNRWDTFSNPLAALRQTVSSRRGPIYRARIYVFATTLHTI